MSQSKSGEERLWQVEARITLPRFIQGKNDGLPSKLTPLNIFQEQCLYKKNGIEIWLRCDTPDSIVRIDSASSGSLKALDMPLGISPSEQHPYKLVTKVPSKNETQVVDTIIGKLDLLTDILSFQLQWPVKIVQLQAFDVSDDLHQGDQCRFILFASTPYHRIAKDARALYSDPVTARIDPDQIKMDLPEKVEAGLRWFVKGLAALPVVDKFTFYWIALEILVSDLVPSEKRFFRCRKCGHEIQGCPRCGSTTKIRPMSKQKIKTFIVALGRKPELFDQLYDTRQMLHGEVKLKNFDEIQMIARQVSELKAIVVDALKASLGITELEPPYSPSPVPFAWSSMGITGYRAVQ